MATEPDLVIGRLEIRQSEVRAAELLWANLLPFPSQKYQLQMWLDSYSFDTVLAGIRKAARRHTRGDLKAQSATFVSNYAELQMLSCAHKKAA